MGKQKLKSFKDFEIFKSYKHKNKEKLLLYLELAYDPDSPLNSETNIDKLKVEAAERAGLDSNDEWVKAVIETKDDQVNEIIFEYSSYYINSNAFQQLRNDQEIFWGIQKLLSKRPDMDDEDALSAKYEKRMKLSAQCDDLRHRINGLLTEIYKDEKVREIATNIIRRTSTPEERLKSMKVAWCLKKPRTPTSSNT